MARRIWLDTTMQADLDAWLLHYNTENPHLDTRKNLADFASV